MAYSCDSDDGNAASILVTILDTGDVMAFCGECFPRWVIGAARSLAEDPADPADPAAPVEHLPVAVGDWAGTPNLDTDPPTPALPIEVERPTDGEPWGDPPVPDMIPDTPPVKALRASRRKTSTPG